MAADWIGIDSSHLDSHCGENVGKTLQEALDGTDYWAHEVEETHWFILDLGQSYNIIKIRGRSDSSDDPTNINVYVNDTGEAPWGDAVATGINIWQDTGEWQEVDTTDKEGQYVKVEIVSTEDGSDFLIFGHVFTPFTIFDVYGEAAPVVVRPAALALQATLQAPTVKFPIQKVLPDVLALETSLQAPTIFTGVIITPDALILQATLQAPTVKFPIQKTFPNALALQATLQTPTVKFPIQKVLSNALNLQATLQAPTIFTGVIITPDALTLQATLQAPTVVIDCTVTPDALVLEAALQVATAVPSLTITPNALVLQATLQAPTIIVDCTITPDALALQATLQAPTVVIDCTVTPDVLTLQATLQISTIHIVFDEIPDFMHKDLIDPYSGGAWLWLCQIVVPTQTTQRIARNTEDVDYGGDIFDKFNFDVSEQVFSSDGSIPQVTLRVFQDVNRRIENIINATNGALGADIKLIRVNEKFLDTPVTALEMDYENLASESDSEWVTFTLGLPNPLTQRYPLEIYNSSMCPEATPTLFKGPACQYAGDDTSCTGTYEDCYAKGNAEFWGGELGLSANVVRV